MPESAPEPKPTPPVEPGWVYKNEAPPPRCRWCAAHNQVVNAVLVVCPRCDLLKAWPDHTAEGVLPPGS